MKRIGAIVALSLLAGGGLAAQDTTKAAAPAQPAAASVSVDEAAVAKNVVDRVPQDTGSVFPVDVGQLVLWTKVSGAAGTALHHVWFHGDTQVGDGELLMARGMSLDPAGFAQVKRAVPNCESLMGRALMGGARTGEMAALIGPSALMAALAAAGYRQDDIPRLGRLVLEHLRPTIGT